MGCSPHVSAKIISRCLANGAGSTRAPRVVFGALAEHSERPTCEDARVIGEGADDCTRGGARPRISDGVKTP
jgi:hypothetical protein